jgi:hypothetical protein
VYNNGFNRSKSGITRGTFVNKEGNFETVLNLLASDSPYKFSDKTVFTKPQKEIYLIWSPHLPQ